jgi:hypothetical protein
VKLVGANLVELAPTFVRWADRLGKDLRVVATGGEAPWQFYGRPLVASSVGPDGLCLFLTGSMASEINGDGVKWRVGLDELMALAPPQKIDGPEFPAYANIFDDKKVFIGRVDGKMVYTMLYVPDAAVNKALVEKAQDVKMNGEASELLSKDMADAAAKPTPQSALPVRHAYAPAPRALEPFLDKVFSQYERVVKDFSAELRGDLTERSFREFCGDSQRKRERKLQEAMDAAARQLRDLEESITRKARELRDAQKDLALVKSGGVDKELADQWRKVRKLVDDGLYEKFKVRHGLFEGMTTDIVIEWQGARHALGKFLVSIDKSGSIKMESESKPFPAHPHLRSNFTCCFGNVGGDLAKLVGLEQYGRAFALLHEYLSSYNPSDRVTKLEVCSGAEKAPVMEEETAARPNGYSGGPVPQSPETHPRKFYSLDESSGLTGLDYGFAAESSARIKKGIQDSIAEATAVSPSALSGMSSGPSSSKSVHPVQASADVYYPKKSAI